MMLMRDVSQGGDSSRITGIDEHNNQHLQSQNDQGRLQLQKQSCSHQDYNNDSIENTPRYSSSNNMLYPNRQENKRMFSTFNYNGGGPNDEQKENGGASEDHDEQHLRQQQQLQLDQNSASAAGNNKFVDYQQPEIGLIRGMYSFAGSHQSPPQSPSSQSNVAKFYNNAEDAAIQVETIGGESTNYNNRSPQFVERSNSEKVSTRHNSNNDMDNLFPIVDHHQLQLVQSSAPVFKPPSPTRSAND